ncbi:hypothetical protein SPRG_20108 [Saprolegnia parasitica CBS 223.65]|uniref:CCZ1/INTU/HSP4 first Longin domain-containing protein n=1 Tax=Saprolegnia parasitica (strain CBS 223.65) TaxID=695850 RepID=A0A067CQA1_SAPPC|nr:hypothetical protein SPRG_20108 [Saprolegnia parasitica CBS 223.65]KDO29002.1 hypothetical protein SPRG_20108 [Saprolegnia parasitica CBS 223.65]|eukprot:XP_012200331.1 hypothetical protein SPRG_20108 [Saprolegnia parasitica CBS 223.65]
MELVLWHDGLGSDDDAATDEESAARVLYFFPPRACADQLNVLQLLQGAHAFASSFGAAAADDATHVQLTTMRYCYRRCESHVWIALGVQTRDDDAAACSEAAMEAAVHQLYATFRLFYGSIEARLATHRAGTSGMDVLKQIGASRKLLRKASSRVLQVRDDADSTALHAAHETVESLRVSLAQLEDTSPIHEFRRVCADFFPVFAHALGLDEQVSCFTDLHGLMYYLENKHLQLRFQLLLQSLSTEIPAIVSAAAFVHGQLVWTQLPFEQLTLLYTVLRLREQEGHVRAHPASPTSLWMDQTHTADFSPVWASKQAYAEVSGSPSPLLKRRPSAREYLAEVTNSFKAPSTAVNHGFQCVDGTYALLGAKELWAPAISVNEKTCHLVVWQELVVTSVFVVDASNAAALSLVCGALQDALDGHAHVREASRRTASPPVASVWPFVHMNRMTMGVQLHNLAKLRGKSRDEAVMPLRLTATSVPRPLLDVLNHAHAEIAAHAALLDVCVQTPGDGWVVARRSGSVGRELYAFFDASVETLGDLSKSMTELILHDFESTFM